MYVVVTQEQKNSTTNKSWLKIYSRWTAAATLLCRAAVLYVLLPCSAAIGLCPFLEVGTSAHCFLGRLERLFVYH